MRDFSPAIGRILLSVPFFLKWPKHVWNWAADAEHVPLKHRDRLISCCFGGIGVVLIYAELFAVSALSDTGVSLWLPLQAVAMYVGEGIGAMRFALWLSRTYRPKPQLLIVGPSETEETQ